MIIFKRQLNRSNLRTGSALVMVIVLTALLSLIGTLFIVMARIDEMSTSSIKAATELDSAVNAVVNKINEVLVEDVFAANWLDGTGNTEPWDYPKHTLDPGVDTIPGTYDDLAFNGGTPYYGTNDDIWLANLEPELLDMAVDWGGTFGQSANQHYAFRHITDLYGTFGYLFQRAYERANQGTNPPTFDSRDLDSDGDRFSMRYLRATIIDPGAPILTKAEIAMGKSPVGQKADADGDGVADSRWARIPNIFGEKGETLYTAVRIIDNGGMININTAYDDAANHGNQWDGSALTHVNLNGIRAATETGLVADFHAERCGTASVLEADFNARSARRLLDPVNGYLPFDIGDELELRNRFFLSSPVINRFGHKALDGSIFLWRTTFDPINGTVGKSIPYVKGDDIRNWFDKVTGPDDPGNFKPGICNRRHLSTTYNSEKIARPYSLMSYPASMTAITPISDSRKFGVTLPIDIQEEQASAVVEKNYKLRLAMALYRGLPDTTTIDARFGIGVYTREQLAWQMTVNMIDHQDVSSLLSGEVVTNVKPSGSNTTYFGTEDLAGLKRDTLCISKFAYTQVTASSALPAPKPPIGLYFAVEVFNPDDAVIKRLTNYELRVIDDLDNLMFSPHEFTTSNPLSVSGGSNNTALVVFSNPAVTSAQAEKALSLSSGVIDELANVSVNLTLLNSDYKVVLVKKSTGMPVDSISVPNSLIPTIGTDTPIHCYRRMVFKDTNFLVPSWSPATDDGPWEGFGVDLNWLPGDYIDTTLLLDSTDSAFAIAFPSLTLAGLEKVQLDAPNAQLRNVGEIENIFAIGASYDISGTTHTCRTLWQGIIDSVMAIGSAADLEETIEMGSFGRIRLDDPDYWPMLDSLTYFDPARDGVDLINIAEGITPTVTAGAIDAGSAPLDTLTDGLFFPRQTGWNAGTVYWTDLTVPPPTEIEIDLGATFEIFGAIIQADDNDEYVLEYHDAGVWYPVVVTDPPLWSLEDYTPLGFSGMHTRPDMHDDGRWHLFDSPVMADKVRVRAINGDDFYSLSEIQIGVKYNPLADDPYYYGDTVPGRININTAPWYVIDQLPWLEDASATEPASLAQAIVAFRDKSITPSGVVDYSGPTGRFDLTNITGIDEDPGFTDIGQLTQLIIDAPSTPEEEEHDIRKYIFDSVNTTLPDYTPDDSIDDFEERNLLFHRISNLVTLRSDVFTAYILVRIGETGPQRRMIAIFDRSGIDSPDDVPRLIALHRVPDPR